MSLTGYNILGSVFHFAVTKTVRKHLLSRDLTSININDIIEPTLSIGFLRSLVEVRQDHYYYTPTSNRTVYPTHDWGR